MKKLLIISPHFPPINAPDMQRVRLVLPWLRGCGWDPTVVAVAPDAIEGGVRDPLLEATYPSDIRIVRVQGVSPRLTRPFGIGNLWWRCGRALTRAAERLLATEKFDLVFFSTTQFDAFRLGPRWKQRFGVPYVLDYQDPWINRYYADTKTRPPGGWLKFGLSQWLAERWEPRILREASGLIAVSDSYGAALARDRPWFDPKRVRLLPFGAAAADYAVVRNYRPEKPLIDFDDGNFHHVYAGRCGPDMSFAMSVLFRAFKLYQASHPALAARTHFHFIGTDYAPPPLGREWAIPVARAEGVVEHVHEHCYRVRYFDALYYLQRANALIAVGSNDPTYSASKIFPYILAARPMLLIFHRSSLVLGFAERVSAGVRFRFNGPEDIVPLAAEVHRRWFVEGERHNYTPYDTAAFAPYTAESLASQLAGIFDAALTATPPSES